MRELLLENRQVQGERGTLRCRYSILIGELPVGGFSCECYGVKIEERQTGEVAQLPDLTVSAQRIDELLEILMRNEVTPAGLADVVADWL